MSHTRSLNNELEDACKQGNARAVKALLPPGAPLHYSRALQIAAEHGHAECVRLLIPLSDPKARSSHALQIAALYGHIECVKMLTPLCDNKKDRSLSLCWAAGRGHADCVAFLLPFADPLDLDSEGLTASQGARAAGRSDVAGMIDAFIEAQALSSLLPHPHAMLAPKASL